MKRIKFNKTMHLVSIIIMALICSAQVSFSQTLTGETNACQGQTEVYTTESGENNYMWRINGGTPDVSYEIVEGGTTADNTIKILWLQPGNYSISINYDGGISFDYDITVVAAPMINNMTDETICSGSTFSNITPAGSGASSFKWEVTSKSSTITNGPAIGDTGTGNITGEQLNGNGTLTYTVTPVANSGSTNCDGTAKTVTITVVATPTVAAIPDQLICSGETFTTVTLSGSTGATLDWKVIGKSGIINGPALNDVGTGPITGTPLDGSGTLTYTVTPSISAGSKTCYGTDETFTITVTLINMGAPDTQYFYPGDQLTISGSANNIDAYVWYKETAAGVPDPDRITAGSMPGFVDLGALGNYSGSKTLGETASGDDYDLSAGTWVLKAFNGSNSAKQTFTIIQNLVLTNTSQTNVSCNGGANGTASISVSGGTGAYTYSWSNGGTAATATGLSAGTYTVTVTDANSCQATKAFTITQPAALAATTSQINATCSYRGEASVTPAGGTPGYTYLWTPSGYTTATAIGLDAGSHSCLITDANGCSITRNVTIATTNTLVAITSQINILCNGESSGSATVIPSGALGPFSYAWSPSGGNGSTATGLAAGNYSVTITAGNGCSIVKTFTITQPPAVKPTFTTFHVSACIDAAVTYTTEPLMQDYLWSISGSEGTDYTKTEGGLTDNTVTITWLSPGVKTVSVNYKNSSGCTAATPTETTTTIDNLTMGLDIDIQICKGSNINLSGTTTGTSWRWEDASQTPLPGQFWSSNEDDKTIEGLEPASTTFYYFAAQNGSCISRQRFDVTVTPRPTPPVLTGDGLEVCEGLVINTAYLLSLITYNNTTDTVLFYTDSGLADLFSGSIVTEYAVKTSHPFYAVAKNIDTGCTTDTANALALTIGVNPHPIIVMQNEMVLYNGSGQAIAASMEVNGNPVAGLLPDIVYTPADGSTLQTTLPIDAGIYNVTANFAGNNNYCAAAEVAATLTIEPKAIGSTGITVSDIEPRYGYTGNAIMPEPIIKDGTVTLVKDADYTLSYSNNTNAGTATITISGIGNYSETKDVSFDIVAKDINDTSITVDAIDDQTYTGNAITPEPIVKDGTVTLVKDADYTLSYSDNVNAGTGTVTIMGIGNYSGERTVNFTIVPAAQSIDFMLPSELNIQANNGSYALTATATSGLPVKYRSDNTAVAEIAADGITLLLNQSGTVTITAYVDDNPNYMPATEVTQTVNITDSGTNVTSVTLNSERYDGSPEYYLMDCGAENITVTVTTEDPNSVVIYNETEGNIFTVNNPAVGIHPITYTVRSQDGTQTKEYTITVEKRLVFDEIIVQKWNNVLLVNNNSEANGGYTFTAFKWFKNGGKIGTKSYYSAGDKKTDLLDASASYYVELTTEDGETLRTCEYVPTLRSAGVSVYPVPVKSGEVIRVETHLPEEQLAKARLEVTGSSGSLMHQQQLTGEITDVRVSFTAGTYLFKVSAEGFEEIVKVVVK